MARRGEQQGVGAGTTANEVAQAESAEKQGLEEYSDEFEVPEDLSISGGAHESPVRTRTPSPSNFSRESRWV